MKNLLIYISIITFLCVFSCRKDRIDDDLSIYTPPPIESYQTEIRGTVFDRALEPIPQTTVTIGDETTTTDKYGHFIFKGTKASEDGSLITFDHPEYFKNYKFVYPTTGGASNVHVLLNPRMGFVEFEASVGGTPVTNLTFPSNSIVDESGTLYEGKVHVYSFYMNTDSPNFNYQVPGDLRAENEAGESVQLGTFGMWTVELETPDGAPLQLGNGKKASLDFKIADDILDVAPTEIPLWHFDKNNGIWMEEGSAVLDGDHFKTEVAHFSTWNCDIPFPTCKMTAKFVDANGKPLVNQSVTIYTTSGIFTGNTMTNSKGEICGPVPLDIEVVIAVLDNCGLAIYEQTKTFSEGNCDVGTIHINENEDLILLEGQLVDCLARGLSTGIILVEIEGYRDQVLYPDVEGNFSNHIFACNLNTMTIKAIDIENLKESEREEYEIIRPITYLDNIAACKALEQFIIVKTNDYDAVNYEYYLEAFILDNSEILIAGVAFSPRNIMIASIPLLEKGTATPQFVWTGHDLNPSSVSDQDDVYCECSEGFNSPYKCSDIVATISHFENGFVGGNISGIGLNTGFFSNGETTEISIDFYLEIIGNLSRTTLAGRIWHDENRDGLRTNDESNLPILESMNSTYGPPGALRSFKIPDVLPTINADGTYSLGNVIDYGSTFFSLKTYQPNNHYISTLRDQGGNDSFDSDFDQGGIGDYGFHRTDFVHQSSLNDKDAIDLGVYDLADDLEVDVDVFGCGTFAVTQITINGGTPPYAYQWNGTPLGTDGIIKDLAPGTYSVTISDSNLLTDEIEWVIPSLNNTIRVKAFLDKNGNNNYDIAIDEVLENVKFTTESPATSIFTPFVEVGITDENGEYILHYLPWNNEDTVYEVQVVTPDGYEIIEANIGADETDNDFAIDPDNPGQGPIITTIVESCEGNWGEFWAGFKEI